MGRYKKIFSGLAILIIGFVSGWFLQSRFVSKNSPVPIREDTNQYQFVNPILFFRTSKSFYIDEFKPLVNILSTEINNDIASNNASSVSVYFNDLDDGHWTGVNEDNTYSPSSMLKVIILMAALNSSLQNPGFLSKPLYYNGPDILNQYYKPANDLPNGNYTVQQLINEMIINSNNGATKALLSDPNINQNFQNIYNDFRLPSLNSSTTTDFMSARSYSSVFRTLYNGTFFSPDLDNQILSLLTKTDFKSGLVAGVPSDILVAHKFGENTYNDSSNNEVHELHDCGIVYYPSHPYLLCVMTRGKQFSDLESVISNLAKITYNFTQSKYK